MTTGSTGSLEEKGRNIIQGKYRLKAFNWYNNWEETMKHNCGRTSRNYVGKWYSNQGNRVWINHQLITIKSYNKQLLFYQRSVNYVFDTYSMSTSEVPVYHYFNSLALVMIRSYSYVLVDLLTTVERKVWQDNRGE